MSIDFTQPPSSASVPDASESVKGKIRIATSAEATAGTDDLTAMTPLKVQSVVNTALVGGVTYQGTFDASSPADLSNASKGDLYIISAAGTYQGQSWAVGDHLLINADMGGTLDSAKIDKVDNTDAVTSVAGRTGAVTLSTADISGLATVASTGAYSDLSGTPTLATVATTGAYSDLSGTPALGTAAALDVGTSASNVVQLDGTGKLPAVDGSQLTNLPSSSLALDDLTDVTITGAATGEVLRYDGAEWVDAQLAYSDLSGTPTLATVATTGAYSDLSGTPTLGTAAALDVGTSASNVVQLDGTGKLPAVDGSQLTNLPGGDAFYQSSVSVTSTATAISDNRRQHYDILTGGVTLTIPQGGASDVIGGVVSVRNASTSDVTFGGTTGVGPVFKTALNTNVYTMTLSPGETRSFVWNGTNALNEVSVSQLSMLGDVNITSASTGEVLRYDGSEWVDAQLAYSDLSGAPTNVSTFTNDAGYISDITAENLGDLADVDLTGLADGEIIIYNATSGKWEANPPPAPLATTTSVGLIEIAENAEATAGTATDKALVPSNISSITTAQLDNSAGTMLEGANNLSDLANAATARTNLGLATIASTGAYSDLSGAPTNVSAFTNDAGYLTSISGVSLGDLDDVDLTGVANANVITYNSTSTNWEVSAVPAPKGTVSTYTTTTALSTPTAYNTQYIRANSSSAITITLPAASSDLVGFRYEIKRIGSGTLTVAANGSDTIEGGASITISVQGDARTIVAVSATSWEIF